MAVIGLSCADYSWLALSHDAALTVISDLGFDAVDVGLFRGTTHVRPEDVSADPDAAADRLRERLSRSRLDVADVFLQVGVGLEACAPNNPEAAVRSSQLAMLRAATTFAARVGATGVTVLPGIAFGGEAPERAIERAASCLEPWIEIVAAAGMRLSVEPHQGSCVDTPDRTVALLERASDLWLTLDPAHYVYSGASTADLTPLLTRTRHVQLRAGAPGVMQARLPDNTIDFPVLIDRLLETGYDGYVATEYVWHEIWECDRVDNLSETARLRDLVRSHLAAR